VHARVFFAGLYLGCSVSLQHIAEGGSFAEEVISTIRTAQVRKQNEASLDFILRYAFGNSVSWADSMTFYHMLRLLAHNFVWQMYMVIM
jgi:hypothetical protein